MERIPVRQVDDAEPDSKLRPIGEQQIVGADAEIEEMPRRDSRRVRDVVAFLEKKS